MEHLFRWFQEKRERRNQCLLLEVTSLDWLLEGPPCFELFFSFLSAYPLQDTAWGQVSLTVPQALWISGAPMRRFSSCSYKKCPQGGSSSSCSTQVPGASVQFSSVKSDFSTPWAAARQASLSISNSRSLLKLMAIVSVLLSNHLILCRPLPLLPSVFPSIRVFSSGIYIIYIVCVCVNPILLIHPFSPA